MAELLPCPFCGGRTSIVLCEERGIKWWTITGATNKNGEGACICRLYMNSSTFTSHSDGAKQKRAALIEAWNRRVGNG